MGSFTQSDAALEWRGGHETVRIEPWGRNSLRVRGTQSVTGCRVDFWAHFPIDRVGRP